MEETQSPQCKRWARKPSTLEVEDDYETEGEVEERHTQNFYSMINSSMEGLARYNTALDMDI